MEPKRQTSPCVFSSARNQLVWQSFHIDAHQSSLFPPLRFPDLSTNRCYFRQLFAGTSLRISWVLPYLHCTLSGRISYYAFWPKISSEDNICLKDQRGRICLKGYLRVRAAQVSLDCFLGYCQLNQSC